MIFSMKKGCRWGTRLISTAVPSALRSRVAPQHCPLSSCDAKVVHFCRPCKFFALKFRNLDAIDILLFRWCTNKPLSILFLCKYLRMSILFCTFASGNKSY